MIPRSIMLPGGGGGGAKIRSSEMTGRVASSAATLAPSKQRQSAIMRMAFSPTILRDRRAEGRAYEVSLPERDVGTSIGSAEKCLRPRAWLDLDRFCMGRHNQTQSVT